jgi:hypothetical protein
VITDVSFDYELTYCAVTRQNLWFQVIEAASNKIGSRKDWHYGCDDQNAFIADALNGRALGTCQQNEVCLFVEI